MQYSLGSPLQGLSRRAGMQRLGFSPRITTSAVPPKTLPAPCQGDSILPKHVARTSDIELNVVMQLMEIGYFCFVDRS